MHTLTDHMEREFRVSGLLSGTDPLEELLVNSLRGLMGVFVKQGHSGGSADMTLSLFDRLAQYKPLTPLTGAESEWIEIPPEMQSGPSHQNIRCTSVFKYPDGRAIDVNMTPVYIDPFGVTTTRSEDRPPEISFPYMPGMPPVIGVDHDGNRL